MMMMKTLTLSLFWMASLSMMIQTEARIRGLKKKIPRKLQTLVGFGGEPDPSRFPLQLCQGDCDNDDEVCSKHKLIALSKKAELIFIFRQILMISVFKNTFYY